MPYKTGKMKGELLTGEIRRLISAHNRLAKITIPKGTKRDGLVKLVADNGFRIDHVKQKLIQTKATKMKPKAKAQPKPAPKAKAQPKKKAPAKMNPKKYLDQREKLIEGLYTTKYTSEDPEMLGYSYPSLPVERYFRDQGQRPKIVPDWMTRSIGAKKRYTLKDFKDYVNEVVATVDEAIKGKGRFSLPDAQVRGAISSYGDDDIESEAFRKVATRYLQLPHPKPQPKP